jgi:serine/threonine protein kinase
MKEDIIIKFLRDIISGFAKLYENNFIHRDLKPENILLHNNVCKVGDYGFGRRVEDRDEGRKMTRIGTPIYASP